MSVTHATPARPARDDSPHQLSISLARGSFRLALDLSWSERVLVLFGPSGAGKSSALEVALGFHPSARARVRLAGRWLQDSDTGLCLPVSERRLGWLPQDGGLFPHLDVRGNVRLGLARAGERGEAELARALEVLEISRLLDRRIRDLSGGERQRVALARALASAPTALLLDEPFSSLDRELRARVLPYLLRVRDELGLPMLIITHDPDEAIVLGERVAVIDGGSLKATGEPREVLWSGEVAPLASSLGLENVLFAVGEGAGGNGESTTEIVCRGGLRLTVPFSVARGSPVTVGLRAEDVLVSLDPLGRISARNCVPGRVNTLLEQANDVLVGVTVSSDQITAKLTRDAVRALALAPGSRVHLVIKAHALRRIG